MFLDSTVVSPEERANVFHLVLTENTTASDVLIGSSSATYDFVMLVEPTLSEKVYPLTLIAGAVPRENKIQEHKRMLQILSDRFHKQYPNFNLTIGDVAREVVRGGCVTNEYPVRVESKD